MMLTSNMDLVNLDVGSAAGMALLGYAVVFLGISLLMIVIMVMGKIFMAKDAKAAAQKAVAPAVQEVVEAAPAAVAPGTAGKLMLHDVPPATAAMIMAIVADKMGKPLNELRFKSIKEVK